MQTSRCHTVLAVLLLPLLGCGALPATEGGASPEADAGPAQHAPDGASGVTSDADADGGVRSGSPCAAVAGFGSTAEAAGEIDLSWTPQAGVACSLQRKSYCGSDGYELLAMLPAGSVSALAYANRFVSVVITLMAGAVSSAVVPHFSRMIAQKDWAGCRHTLITWVRLTALVSTPIALALIAGSHLLIRTAFQQGTSQATKQAKRSPMRVLWPRPRAWARRFWAWGS